MCVPEKRTDICNAECKLSVDMKGAYVHYLGVGSLLHVLHEVVSFVFLNVHTTSVYSLFITVIMY